MVSAIETVQATYTTESGERITVEAIVPSGYSERQISTAKPNESSFPKLRDTIKTIIPALKDISSELERLTPRPDEISVVLGIKFIGETGVIIARASTEASLQLSLKWTAGQKDRNLEFVTSEQE